MSSVELSKMPIKWPTADQNAHDQDASRQNGTHRNPGGTGRSPAYRINDAAEPLEDEDRRPVVIQVVALGCLNAHSHEGLGFRFCTCQKSVATSVRRELHTHTQ